MLSNWSMALSLLWGWADPWQKHQLSFSILTRWDSSMTAAQAGARCAAHVCRCLLCQGRWQQEQAVGVWWRSRNRARGCRGCSLCHLWGRQEQDERQPCLMGLCVAHCVCSDGSCIRPFCHCSQGKCHTIAIKAWRCKGRKCQLNSLTVSDSCRTGRALSTALSGQNREDPSPHAVAAPHFPFPQALWAPGRGENLKSPKRKANFVTLSFLGLCNTFLVSHSAWDQNISVSSRKVSLWLLCSSSGSTLCNYGIKKRDLLSYTSI